MPQKKKRPEPPRTRAVKPIAILKAVIKAIRDEPLRYDQTDWVTRYSLTAEKTWSDRPIPACGTVGCVAGWIATLKRDAPVPGYDGIYGPGTSDTAAAHLGLDERQARRLFDGDALGRIKAKPGTRAYANAGIKHIELFMRQELGYTGPKL